MGGWSGSRRMKELTQEYLRSILHYDPVTGIFTWLVSLPGPVKAGNVAGSVNTIGYREITINQVRFLAHRLAWFYQTGVWPKHLIDHENMNTDDNRFLNLREATKSTNSANTKVKISNMLGVKGVGITATGKYRARIVFNGVARHVGTYDTPELASEAYAKAANEHFGEFARVA